jgi:phosphohistidine phosphatase
MILYLLRHGEAVQNAGDSERVLTANGFEETRRMAAYFKNKMEMPLAVYHSPKIRTTQTAECFTQGIGFDGELQVNTDLAPDQEVDDIYTFCQTLKENTLLVGHFPILPALSTSLINGGITHPVLIHETSGLVGLRQTSPGDWHLLFSISPRFLED